MGLIVSHENIEIRKAELHPGGKYMNANYIALTDYVKRSKREISMRKNDKLLVYNQNQDKSDWWEGKNLRTNQKGFINPRAIRKYDSLEIKEYKAIIFFIFIV